MISQPRGPTRKRRMSPVAGIGGQQLVVADAVVARSARRCDEFEMSVAIHSRPSGSTVSPSGEPKMSARLQLDRGVVLRIAGQHEDVPGEASAPRGRRLRFPQADDLPVRIGLPGVDRIGTAAAVGERHEHVAARRVDRHPLGPVELGGADRVGRLPGPQQDVGLVGPALGGGEGTLAVGERHPRAPVVVVEAGDVEDTVVERRLALGPELPARAPNRRTCRGTRRSRRHRCRRRSGRPGPRRRRRSRA